MRLVAKQVFCGALTPDPGGISCAEQDPTSVTLHDTSKYSIHFLLSKTSHMSQLNQDQTPEFFVVVACLSSLKKKKRHSKCF